MFKKIIPVALVALALASCDNGDYTDWVLPEQNAPVEAVKGEMTAAAATTETIDLAKVEGETVKLINANIPADATVESYKVTLANAEGATYDVFADAEGNVKVEDLQNAVTTLYNREAVERELTATVSANVTMKGQQGEAVVAYAASPFTLKLQCIPPKFAENIYFIGATDGWSQAEQTLVGDGNGHYTGYIYCADPNGWGNQFKFQQVPGDWGTEINNSNFNTYAGAATDCGGNLGVSGGENVYYFDVDLVSGYISATEVTMMGIIGDFNGWASDAVMTWDAANYCYVCNNPGINANGWKFRVNADWALNLGGTLDNLVGNGDNLSAVGSVVKLYPCRRGTTKIYCTVE